MQGRGAAKTGGGGKKRRNADRPSSLSLTLPPNKPTVHLTTELVIPSIFRTCDRHICAREQCGAGGRGLGGGGGGGGGS